MNRCHAVGHLAVILAGLAGAVLTFAAVPAALAATPPGRARLLSWADPPLPPGWNKHPQLPDPARVHAALAAGIPGWQLTLMAVTIVLLTATLVAIAYPGPGRTPTEERRHRLNDDRIRRYADPPGATRRAGQVDPGRSRPLNRSQPGNNRSP